MLLRRVAPTLLLVLFAAACGTTPRLTADQYYTEGKNAFGEENYEVAITSYKNLLDQYPFDPHAEDARNELAAPKEGQVRGERTDVFGRGRKGDGT